MFMGICKLPFIDEERLLASTKLINKELTEEEAKRNAENADNGELISYESSHLSNGSMDDHNRGSGQMMDGTQINIDVTTLGAIISLGLMYLKLCSQDLQL
uniref:Xrn1 helical domain-containing protein n=1 Tax=Lactuca sativa TaxID=4236 RepID=A0A9R1XUJ3_LACSA|nr:hypothetical protein LSAT_V11C100046230 [Lactuca sativa]